MKYSIFPSIIIYKPRVVNKGGLSSEFLFEKNISLAQIYARFFCWRLMVKKL